MSNKTSQHILSTSANLLGFCLFVITSLHISNRAEKSLIDEFTSVVGLLLVLSCVFSFLSLRTQSLFRSRRVELMADYLFFAALSGILLIIVLIVFGVLK